MRLKKDTIDYKDFERVDIRVGKVLDVRPYSAGKYSTHILTINFGEDIGTKKSLARLAPNYEGSELLGKEVFCVINFEPKQIGEHRSEVLTLGVPDEVGNAVLVHPERSVPLGGGLF